MNEFDFMKLDIPGAILVTSKYSEDQRGSFTKYYEKEIFDQSGLVLSVCENFVSISQKNVLRGLHFQLNQPQIKLVSSFYGEIFDVIVDLRRRSPTYMKWYGTHLSADNHKSLVVPRGCAHGFVAVSECCIVNYLCDGCYDKETDGGIRYDDPDIGVEWPVASSDAIVNERDMKLKRISEYGDNELQMLDFNI